MTSLFEWVNPSWCDNEGCELGVDSQAFASLDLQPTALSDTACPSFHKLLPELV